jgi:diadenosine tetraphosphate (Ap4A) HIT family hydrolase
LSQVLGFRYAGGMSAPDTFRLHPRLAEDCRLIGDLSVSRALLMDDRRFPWVILVPRRPELRELHDLPAADRFDLLSEIEAVSLTLLDGFGATKINVGMLGNLVPQLHVHVVGRCPEDPAWPGPVWGSGTAERYQQADLAAAIERLRSSLNR